MHTGAEFNCKANNQKDDTTLSNMIGRSIAWCYWLKELVAIG